MRRFDAETGRTIYETPQELYDSDHWKKLRRFAWAYHNGTCYECGKYDIPLDLHHLHYNKPYGIETINDVMLFCRECHIAAHTMPDGTYKRNPFIVTWAGFDLTKEDE